MTIDFYEDKIARKEKLARHPYIGYFAKDGTLVDFNTMIGNPGHDEWRNPVSLTFLGFCSYAIEGTSIKNLYNEGKLERDFAECVKCPGIDEYVIRGLGLFYDFNDHSYNEFLDTLDGAFEYIKSCNHDDPYNQFQYELLIFLKNAYSGKVNFFDTINKKIMINSESDFFENNKKRFSKSMLQNIAKDRRRRESIYRNYITSELMQHFKDIAVMYLGYDAIERFKPNGDILKIPYWYENYNYEKDFLKNPRTITSSYPNVNERYYNYKLMNWDIHKVIGYFFNEESNKYEKKDEFLNNYQTEKEQILEQEIQSIKRLVPLKDRYKYFR